MDGEVLKKLYYKHRSDGMQQHFLLRDRHFGTSNKHNEREVWCLYAEDFRNLCHIKRQDWNSPIIKDLVMSHIARWLHLTEKEAV